MAKIKYWVCILFLHLIIKPINCDADANLLDQYEENIDPSIDQNIQPKEHNKRTIFSPNYNNYGWAKHVRIKSGKRIVLGYSPVDLKYVPVAKPILLKPIASHHGWRFKPKQQWKPKPIVPLLPLKPIYGAPVIHTDGWKPVIPAHVPDTKPWRGQGWTQNKPVTVLKPIVPGIQQPMHTTTVLQPSIPLKPALEHHVDHIQHGNHVDHYQPIVPTQPVLHHVDHIKHGNHVHHVDHFQPLVPQQPVEHHVDHIQHGDHLHHLDHYQPIVPQQPVPHHVDYIPHGNHVHHVDHIQPIVPQYQPPLNSLEYYNYLLNWHKQHLPVLPLGATFPSPVLQPNPHVHVPQVHEEPHEYPQHFHHNIVPHIHPGVHHAVPHVYQEPHIHQDVPHLHSHLPQIPHIDPYIPNVHQHHVDQAVHPGSIHLDQAVSYQHPGFPHVDQALQYQHPASPHVDLTMTQALPHLRNVVPHLHNIEPHLHNVHPNHFDQPVTHLNPVPASHVDINHSGHPNINQHANTGAASIEFHGKQAHLIRANFGNAHLRPNPVQYVPENYNPHMLPGVAGHPQDLSNFYHPHQPHLHDLGNPEDAIHDPNHTAQHPEEAPNAIRPGHTDVQIPVHLPEHPNYRPYDLNNFQTFFGFQNPGIVKPAISLEPPIH